MKKYTRRELARFNGQDGEPVCVGLEGYVYDLTGSFTWKKGRHQARHTAGKDLTEPLLFEAPHGKEMVERFPVLGSLEDPLYWLLKTEPEEYSWDNLRKDKNPAWDGVRGGAALKNLNDMRYGDRAFIYHTGKEKQIVGIAAVESDPYPDPLQEDQRYLVVTVSPLVKLQRPVSLQELKQLAVDEKASEFWTDWELFKNPRLSVVPVSQEKWDRILSLSLSF